MTPFGGQQLTAAEKRYNDAHAKTRNTIERTFGVLKSRMRCIDKSGGALQYSPSKVCKIIIACAILNNICRLNGMEMNDDGWAPADKDGGDHEVDENENGGNGHALAVQLRRDVVANCFS